MRHVVPFREPLVQLLPVLLDASFQIIGNPDVQRTPATRHDVHVVGLHWSDINVGQDLQFPFKQHLLPSIPPSNPVNNPRFRGPSDLGMAEKRRTGDNETTRDTFFPPFPSESSQQPKIPRSLAPSRGREAPEAHPPAVSSHQLTIPRSLAPAR